MVPGYGPNDNPRILVCGRRRVEYWSDEGREAILYDANRPGWQRSDTNDAVRALATNQNDVGKHPLVVDASADGKWIAYGLRGGDVSILLADSPRTAWKAARQNVNQLRFSNQGHWVAAACGLGGIAIHDAKTGDVVCQLESKGNTGPLLFDRDDRRLIATVAKKRIKCWSLPSGQLNATFRLPINIRQIQIAGNELLVGMSDHSLQWLSLPKDDQEDQHILTTNPMDPFAFIASSPDSKYWAVADVSGELSLWSKSDNLKSDFRLNFDSESISAMAFSRDGKRLVTGARDGRIEVWKVPSLELTASAHPNATRVGGLDLSPDGKVMATGHFDGQVILWDTQTWEPQLSLDSGIETIRDLRFSTTGTRLVVGGNSDQIVVYSSED